MNGGCKVVLSCDPLSTNDKKQCWEIVFQMQMQQKNTRDDNFYFPKYIISSSQTSIDTIWEIRVN